MCVFEAVSIAALWDRQSAPHWSLLLISAKTQEALKSRAQIMQTGLTAGTHLNSRRETQPAAQCRHTRTNTSLEARIHFLTNTLTCTVSHCASKSGGNLTVRARWIAVDSRQETSNCWLFLFWGLFIGALQSGTEGGTVEWISMCGRLANWKGRS